MLGPRSRGVQRGVPKGGTPGRAGLPRRSEAVVADQRFHTGRHRRLVSYPNLQSGRRL
jgi:hypothetical protein